MRNISMHYSTQSGAVMFFENKKFSTIKPLYHPHRGGIFSLCDTVKGITVVKEFYDGIKGESIETSVLFEKINPKCGWVEKQKTGRLFFVDEFGVPRNNEELDYFRQSTGRKRVVDNSLIIREV